MLNNKVVAGSLSLALLAAPSLFGLDVASAAAYTKAAKKPTLAAAYTKAAKKPTFTISGAVNAAVRSVDNGHGLRQDKNVLVGQSYSDFEDSHIQAVAKSHSGGFDLTGVLRISSRLNSFARYDEDNTFVASALTPAAGADDEVYLRAADVRLSHKTFGELRIGKASTATAESTKASFAQTGYLRGDVSNIASVSISPGAAPADVETAGYVHGSFGLNHSQHRIQYTAPEFVKGLSLSTEYVSQSDERTIATAPAINSPRFDSMGFAGSYASSMSGVDFDLRAGYTSRAWEPYFYNDSAAQSSTVNGGDWHASGLGLSGALKYMGFDGSVAYAKLDPKGLVNTLGDNFTSTTINTNTNRHGNKAATLTAFELGYSADVAGLGNISLNGEMSTSSNFRNADAKVKIKGVRLAHDIGCVKLYGNYHQTSFAGFKTELRTATNALGGLPAVPKNIDSWIVGAYYKF
jgi:hypothetical protein